MAHNAVTSGYRHGQTATVALKTATDTAVFRVKIIHECALFPRLFRLAGVTVVIALLLALGSRTCLFGLGLRPATRLRSGTGTSLFHLYSYQTVYLGVDLLVLFALLCYYGLYGFLLLFQRCNHLFLLRLLAFKVALLALALAQKGALVLLCGGQLGVFLGDFRLFGLHHLALCALVTGIFAHETQPTEHLGEVLCAENEHQLVLYGAVVVHVTHGLDILVLAVFKLRLQHFQLAVQLSDVAVKTGYVVADGVYGASLVGYFGVNDHQVTQTPLHVALIGAQTFLLSLDIALYLCALVLQPLYRRCAGSRVFLLRCRGCAFLGRGCLPALRLCSLFLCGNRLVAPHL